MSFVNTTKLLVLLSIFNGSALLAPIPAPPDRSSHSTNPHDHAAILQKITASIEELNLAIKGLESLQGETETQIFYLRIERNRKAALATYYNDPTLTNKEIFNVIVDNQKHMINFWVSRTEHTTAQAEQWEEMLSEITQDEEKRDNLPHIEPISEYTW